LKQNFSKQVFGYFMAAKSDKERKIPEKMELAEKGLFSDEMPLRVKFANGKI
jgi:hypothetical protein